MKQELFPEIADSGLRIDKYLSTVNEQLSRSYIPVSYTHLDVYKRQQENNTLQKASQHQRGNDHLRDHFLIYAF